MGQRSSSRYIPTRSVPSCRGMTSCVVFAMIFKPSSPFPPGIWYARGLFLLLLLLWLS
jgi:hypothetical protein